MNNIININCNEKNDIESKYPSHYPLNEIEKLTYVVMASARSVYLALGPALPKCIYQLNLYNDLLKKGLRLQTEMSILNQCVEHEPERELLIVNESLLVECVVENRMPYHFQKRVMFDLENTMHTKGLLINFSEMRNDMITVIDKTSLYH